MNRKRIGDAINRIMTEFADCSAPAGEARPLRRLWLRLQGLRDDRPQPLHERPARTRPEGRREGQSPQQAEAPEEVPDARGRQDNALVEDQASHLPADHAEADGGPDHAQGLREAAEVVPRLLLLEVEWGLAGTGPRFLLDVRWGLEALVWICFMSTAV